ncbi:MAG TPA: hypothetical protein VFU94_02835 [Conexibacter sp.]|nr:hypothetical protein [Conexibacter sp.]
MGGLTEASTCSVEGTSGGPLYKNKVAYGTVVAGNTNGSCDTLYEPAPNELSGSGVRV